MPLFYYFRKGDIKFYLNPYRDVTAITKPKALHTALQTGNLVRVTVEMDKCSGGHSDPAFIGGELRGWYSLFSLLHFFLSSLYLYQYFIYPLLVFCLSIAFGCCK